MPLVHYVSLNNSFLYLYYVFTSAIRHQKQLLFWLCRIHVKLKNKEHIFPANKDTLIDKK